jgi:hypothetical protein
MFTEFYNHFVELVITSFFVAAPQGRISAHWELKYI